MKEIKHMGWLGFPGLTKLELIDYLLKRANGGLDVSSSPRAVVELIDYHFGRRSTGQGLERTRLWTVWREVNPEQIESRRWIALYVVKIMPPESLFMKMFGAQVGSELDKSIGNPEPEPGHWGFMEVLESAEPSALDCPFDFLAKVPLPEDEDFSPEGRWRSRVTAYWQGYEAASGSGPRDMDGDEG